ncbi:MAG: hypothetical protein JXE06_10800 [Coriobacteriia bacterium]|nr:hypothetical protein [Coriobacteriia bacterium]
MLAGVPGFKGFDGTKPDRGQTMFAGDVYQRVYGQLSELAFGLDGHSAASALLNVLVTGRLALSSFSALSGYPVATSPAGLSAAIR